MLDALYAEIICIMTNDAFENSCSPQIDYIEKKSINNKITFTIFMLTKNSKNVQEVFRTSFLGYYKQMLGFYTKKIDKKILSIQNNSMTRDNLLEILSNDLFRIRKIGVLTQNAHPRLNFFNLSTKSNFNLKIFVFHEFVKEDFVYFQLAGYYNDHLLIFYDP